MSINAISPTIPQRIPTGQTNGLATQRPGVTGGLSGQLPQSNAVNNLNNLTGINSLNGLNGSNRVTGANTPNGLNPVNSTGGTAETGLTPSPAELFRILMASMLNSLAQGTGNPQSSNIFTSSLTGDDPASTLANCQPGTETGTGTGTGTGTQTTGLNTLGATGPNALSNPSTPLIPTISPTNPSTFNPFSQARIA